MVGAGSAWHKSLQRVVPSAEMHERVCSEWWRSQRGAACNCCIVLPWFLNCPGPGTQAEPQPAQRAFWKHSSQGDALSEISHESVGSAHGVLPVTAGWPCCLAGLAAGGHDRIRTNPHTELEIVFRPTLTRTWSGLPPNWISNANPHAHLARAAILSYD